MMECHLKKKLSELKSIEEYLQKRNPSYIDSFSLAIGLGRDLKAIVPNLLYSFPEIYINVWIS